MTPAADRCASIRPGELLERMDGRLGQGTIDDGDVEVRGGSRSRSRLRLEVPLWPRLRLWLRLRIWLRIWLRLLARVWFMVVVTGKGYGYGFGSGYGYGR